MMNVCVCVCVCVCVNFIDLKHKTVNILHLKIIGIEYYLQYKKSFAKIVGNHVLHNLARFSPLWVRKVEDNRILAETCLE